MDSAILSFVLRQVGDSESEAGSGDLEGGRCSRVHRRRVGSVAVQGRGLDESGPRRTHRRGRRRLQLEAARDGDLHAVRGVPLLRLVVLGPVKGGKEVPGDLLQRRAHLPHQLPSGRGAELGPPARLRHVASQVQVGHRHGAVFSKQRYIPLQLHPSRLKSNYHN